jgi:hypothetical protein
VRERIEVRQVHVCGQLILADPLGEAGAALIPEHEEIVVGEGSGIEWLSQAQHGSVVAAGTTVQEDDDGLARVPEGLGVETGPVHFDGGQAVILDHGGRHQVARLGGGQRVTPRHGQREQRDVCPFG